jgi:FKBP-type peptidyl-prolyl cis-trans isomerase
VAIGGKMIKNEDKKTSPRQRLVILAIAAFMLLSTFALYASIVINYGNTTEANKTREEKELRFNALYTEYQNQLDAQAKELSDKYFNEFVQYKGRNIGFNNAIYDLKVQDLKVGSGREIADVSDTDYAAYYIGWLSDETVFDSSFDNIVNPTALKAPLSGSTSMIQGWIEGIARSTNDEGAVEWEGMRIGGVREITIPAALAYGDTDNGDIPAGSSLKFVVMLVEKPEEIEVSEELEQLYTELYGA